LIPPVILYRGTLVSQSPLMIGEGNAESLVDLNECRRDGSGFPVIPGSALAGVFFEELAWLRSELHAAKEDFWEGLSGKLPDQRLVLEKAHAEDKPNSESNASSLEGRSALRFASAPLLREANQELSQWLDVRDRIKLDPRLGTVADEGNKFAQRHVIAGARFAFELEIETSYLKGGKEKKAANLKLLEQVLVNWREGFWAGGSIGAGNGWLRLDGLERWAVDAKTYPLFLEATDPFEVNDPATFSSLAGTALPRYVLLPIQITIESEPDEDLWGWDFLQLHQGENSAFASRVDAPFYTCRLHYPRDLVPGLEGNKAFGDHYTLPGSSLRGAMRAFLSHWLPEAEIKRIFGEIAGDDSGRRGLIRVRDAYGPQVEDKPWIIVGHAEDEFTAGTFDSALFEYQPLLNGTFHGMIAVPEADQALIALLDDVFFPAADQRLIALGHGGGHAKWKVVPTQDGEVKS